MVSRYVIAGVSVCLAADRLRFGVDLLLGAGIGAFLQDVLEQVRDTGAQVLALVHRAGFYIEPNRDHRRSVVLANQNRQPVGQSPLLRVLRKGRNDQSKN